MTFTTYYNMRRHIEIIHSGEDLPVVTKKTFQCDEPGCESEFARQDYLNAHKRNVHPASVDEFSCEFCFKSFKSKKSIYQHQTRNKVCAELKQIQQVDYVQDDEVIEDVSTEDEMDG